LWPLKCALYTTVGISRPPFGCRGKERFLGSGAPCRPGKVGWTNLDRDHPSYTSVCRHVTLLLPTLCSVVHSHLLHTSSSSNSYSSHERFVTLFENFWVSFSASLFLLFINMRLWSARDNHQATDHSPGTMMCATRGRLLIFRTQRAVRMSAQFKAMRWHNNLDNSTD